MPLHVGSHATSRDARVKRVRYRELSLFILSHFLRAAKVLYARNFVVVTKPRPKVPFSFELFIPRVYQVLENLRKAVCVSLECHLHHRLPVIPLFLALF